MLDIIARREEAQSLRDQGYTCVEVGLMLGMSQTWVHKWTGKTGKPWRKWTDSDIVIMQKMLIDGKTHKQVAKKLGRNVNQVRIKWHRTPHTKPDKRTELAQLLEAVEWRERAIELGCDPAKAGKIVKKSDVVGRYW